MVSKSANSLFLSSEDSNRLNPKNTFYTILVPVLSFCPTKNKNIFQFGLDKRENMCYNVKVARNLGVAQLGERYLGVVEAARSSRVTQTKNP